MSDTPTTPAPSGADPKPKQAPGWVGVLRSHVRELIYVATDATLPVDERHLGRRAARLRVKGTGEAIDALLASLSGGEPLWRTEARARDACAVQAEMGVMLDAWRELLRAQDEGEAREALSGLPLEGLLFVGLATIYEGAEMDPPVVGVLVALRNTVAGWAHAHGASTLYSAVPFADLTMLARRLDVAIEIVRRTPVVGGAS
jgi:hypothetical protein